MADRDDYWFFQSQTAPGPLAAPQGEAWWLLWGHTKDAWREGAREATKASLPLLCAPDALGEQAAERSTERYPGESEPDYRQRLVETFDRYLDLGTPPGVTDAVDATPGVLSTIYREAWQWDPGSPQWARFWLVCTTTYDGPLHWEDPALVWDAPGFLFDLTASRADLDFFRRQLARWKAAHAKLETCALLIDGAHVWDEPGLSWDDVGFLFDEGHVALLES